MLACAALLGACHRRPPNPGGANPTRTAPGSLEPCPDRGRGCEQRERRDTTDCEAYRGIARLAVEFRDPEALLALAVIEFERGRKEDALKTLDVLRSLEPIHPEAAILRARIAIDEGNLPRADFSKSRASSSRIIPVLELLASVAYLEGEYGDADRSLEIASRLGAPAWRVAYHRGLVAEASGRLDRAARAYAACLEASPDFAPAQSRLRGLAVLEEGD